MFCPKCGRPVQQGSAFCMHCGQQLAPRVIERPGSLQQQPAYPGGAGAIPVRQPQTNKWLWPVIIGLLLLLAALVGGAFLLAQAKPSSSPLMAKASLGPVPIMAGKPTMPKDIYDWLDHLRQTEDRKNKLAMEQLAKVQVILTKIQGLGGAYTYGQNGDWNPEDIKSPTEGIAQDMGDMRGPWRDVIKFFESVPPPKECQDLANTYDRALDEIPGEMGDLGDALSGSTSDPTAMVEKLSKLQGQSSTTIGKYFSVSDSMVSQICDKYNTRKWFTISPDVGTPMTASPGAGLVPTAPKE